MDLQSFGWILTNENLDAITNESVDKEVAETMMRNFESYPRDLLTINEIRIGGTRRRYAMKSVKKLQSEAISSVQ